MSATLTFHVPPDAHPEMARAILYVLASGGDHRAPPAALKEDVAAILGRPPRTEALALLRDLDLITQTPRAIRLTPLGQVVAGSAEAADLIHGLSYFAWSDAERARLSRLWTYRRVVDLLWELAPVKMEAGLKKRLVEDILAQAGAEFATTDGFDRGRTSVGPKSVDGVLRWLEQLRPPIVRGQHLERRQRCAPALMLLALSAVLRQAEAELGADFRLGSQERNVLCRACFLEPTALDAMLEWTVQTQPQYARWGTPNARYGRQIVLVRPWPQ